MLSAGPDHQLQPWVLTRCESGCKPTTGPRGGLFSHSLVLVSVLEIVWPLFAPVIYHEFASVLGFSLVPVKSRSLQVGVPVRFYITA